jgi:hypothetical protein
VQVREVDPVVVHDAEPAYPRRGEVEQQRRAEPAGADDEHPRVAQAPLPHPADLRQDDLAGVAPQLGVAELGHGGLALPLTALRAVR